MIWGSGREEGGPGGTNAQGRRRFPCLDFPGGRVGDRCLRVGGEFGRGPRCALGRDKYKVKSHGGGQPVYPGPGEWGESEGGVLALGSGDRVRGVVPSQRDQSGPELHLPARRGGGEAGGRRAGGPGGRGEGGGGPGRALRSLLAPPPPPLPPPHTRGAGARRGREAAGAAAPRASRSRSLNRSASRSRAEPQRAGASGGSWTAGPAAGAAPRRVRIRRRWRRRRLPAGSGHGRRELREGRSAERGHRGPVGAQRAGAEVGAAGSSERGLRPGHPGLQGPMREAERGEGVLNRTPAWASRTPARLEPRG